MAKNHTMFGRVPPHNLEAEASLLGSVLLDQESLGPLQDTLSEEAFYKESHRIIWAAMCSLRASGTVVDLVSLSLELQNKNQLAHVGGNNYLVDLANNAHAANVEYYAQIVIEKWTLRRLIEAAAEGMKMAYEEAGSLKDIIKTATQKIMEVALQGNKTKFQSMRELMNQTFEYIQTVSENKGLTSGVRSGFRELDTMIGGLAPGSLNIIAARPSMGKTALALTIAQNVSLREGMGVAIFSLEMSAIQLVTRMLCSEARVNSTDLQKGKLSDRDFSRLVEAAGRLSEASLIIDDGSDINLQQLRSKARRLAAQHSVGLVVIDYLQLISGHNPMGRENRQQEIAAISRGLKGLARELNVPVIALSQLSRAVENRPNKRPMLSDLRESGSIEQDADLVMFIYRDDYYNVHSEKAGIAEIIIGKQRNGPTGVTELQFHANHVRFNDLAKDGM